ncbi:MAG: hypothetical protein FJ358_05890 [Thaumarchaeota archaeon]|nr:hypothetical protein [Nitrososphaerota archaeon]
MSEEVHFSLEKWLTSVIELVFWLILFVPLLLANFLLIILPDTLKALGIDKMITPNELIVSLIDPTKAVPTIMIPVTFAVLPKILIPGLIFLIISLTVFFYEREKNVITVSRYAPIRAFKETLLGLLLLLFPITPWGPGFKDFKVARFVEPTLPVWRSIWATKEKIWPSDWANPTQKEAGH